MFITAIAALSLAYYIVNVVQLSMAIKRAFDIHPTRRLKPIDCMQCLTVWLAVVLYFSPLEVSQFIAVVFGAGFISTKFK